MPLSSACMTALSEEPAAQPPTATRTRNEQFGIREGACTDVMQGVIACTIPFVTVGHFRHDGWRMA